MISRSCNTLMLNGIPAWNAVFSVNPINYDMTSFSDVHRKFVQIGIDCSLHMELVLGDSPSFADRMLKGIAWGDRSNFVLLGKGWVCQYCGDYNPAGLLSCINCGGQTAPEFACVKNFPFWVSQYDINSDSFGIIKVSVDFEFSGYKEPIYPFSFGIDIRTLPYAYTLQEHLYVCQYCGRTVENGQKCPGCGGARIPLSEVVKMENTCLYCGNKVIGGIICKSCGAALKSVAYHEVGRLNE